MTAKQGIDGTCEISYPDLANWLADNVEAAHRDDNGHFREVHVALSQP